MINLLKRLHSRDATKQFIRFLLIGGISTLINYLTFLLSLNALNLHYLISNIIGFIAGISFGYPFNKKWTFKHNADQSLFHSYFAVYLISLLISSIFLKISVDFIGIIPEISSLMAICITTCTNFLGMKYWVFKK